MDSQYYVIGKWQRHCPEERLCSSPGSNFICIMQQEIITSLALETKPRIPQHWHPQATCLRYCLGNASWDSNENKSLSRYYTRTVFPAVTNYTDGLSCIPHGLSEGCSLLVFGAHTSPHALCQQFQHPAEVCESQS